MSKLIPISQARAHLSQLIRDAADENVILMNHGHPAAILISPARYEAILEELEDAEDRLSYYERENLTMPVEKLVAELGIADEINI